MNTADWIDEQTKRLAASPLVGYSKNEPVCAEPVAMAALAACGHGLRVAAETCCQRLRDAQNRDGSVSTRLDADGPFWTTSLACIAWRQFELEWPEIASALQCRDAYRNGIDFLLSFGGEIIPPNEDVVGHNTQLVGWPWVKGTHSWLEPTAFALLALRHCEHATHPRALEAAELISDRLLPDGGTNYGNTTVLRQTLRPHVLPSAICVVALHRVANPSPRLAATANYLRDEITHPLAATSLAWSIQAIVSYQWDQPAQATPDFQPEIRSALARMRLSGDNPHRQNLLLLASKLRESPLLRLPAFRIAPSNTSSQPLATDHE